VLNYVAIMNYDEYGQWSATAGPNSALDDTCAPAAAQQGSAVSAVKAWTGAGMPANQLVLGVASYGHAFNVAPSDAFSSGTAPSSTASVTATASSTAAAETTDAPTSTDSADSTYTVTTIANAYVDSDISYRYRRHDGEDHGEESNSGANGTLALFPKYSKWQYATDETPALECGKPAQKDVSFTFAALVKAGYLTESGAVAQGYSSTFDSCSQTPFLYDESKQMLVSYDDARAFTAKGNFIKSSGLLGFAMWEASGDHADVLLDAIRAGVSGNPAPAPSSSSSPSNSGTASATPTTNVESATVTDTPYPTETSHCDDMN
jgi:chitinase